MTRQELLPIAKPILFNTEMVQAILEGRKTVTRRVIKRDISNQFDCEADGTAIAYIDQATGDSYKPWEVCRFKKGDYLYVRETWSEWTGGYLYKAWTSPFHQPGKSSIMRWYPSIHMPKEAARLFLKVTDVRVERLQDMEEEDAINEGIHPKMCPNCSGLDCDLCSESEYTVMDEFMYLWNSTIKKADLDKYGWDASPWVWVIEFEKVEV